VVTRSVPLQPFIEGYTLGQLVFKNKYLSDKWQVTEAA